MFKSSFRCRCRCCCQVSGCLVTVLGIVISILRHVVNDISPHKTSSPSPRLPGPGSALAASIHHNELWAIWASRPGMKVSLRVTTHGKWTITLNSDLSFVASMFFESVFTGNLNLIDSARCLFWWCQADCSLTFSSSNFISTNRDDYFCVFDPEWKWHPDVHRMTRASSCTWVRLGCTAIMTQCMPSIPAVLHIAPCSFAAWCSSLGRVVIKIYVS